MLTVVAYRSDAEVARAEAETPEAALLAGRTLWDEALDLSGFGHVQGARRAIAVAFFVEDELVRRIEGRRP